MKQSYKRLSLLFITVITGSVLILLDAPLFLVLLGTIAVGVILLVLLGGKKINNNEITDKPLKPERAEKSGEDTGHISSVLTGIRLRLANRKVKSKEPAEKAGLSVLVNQISARTRETLQLFRTFFSKPGGVDEMQKIDSLLDETVGINLESTIPFQSTGISGESEEFLFDMEAEPETEVTAVPGLDADEELDEDFNFEDEDFSALEEGLESVNPEMRGSKRPAADPKSALLHNKEAETDQADDIPVDREFGDQIPDLLEVEDPNEDVGSQLDSGFPDLPGDYDEADLMHGLESDDEDPDSLSGFSELELGDEDFGSLDDLELDEEDASETEEQENAAAEIKMISEAPKAPAPAAEEPVSLDFSGGGSSDIMDMLRADASASVKQQDFSLVREMKDVDVDAAELEEELKKVRDELDRKIQRST